MSAELVFVAGATGAIGAPLVRELLAAGHEVVGTSRSPAGAARVDALGARGVVCDALDRPALTAAVQAAAPTVVVHQLTAIPPAINPRRMATQFAATNRLRTEGTANLVAAAAAAGARRAIAQSIAFAYAPTGSPAHGESDPLHRDGAAQFRPAVAALDTLEQTVREAPGIEGVVLRYGYLYGPGTSYAADGAFADQVRARRVPIVGDGGGVFSFVHVDDAASATVAALAGPPGTYNVVDDRPARVDEWLPAFAAALGAPKPRRVPALVARLAAGAFGVYTMTRNEGASNAAIRSALGWAPSRPDPLAGLADDVAGA